MVFLLDNKEMHRILAAILLLFVSISAWAQENADFGVSLGVSTYMGDINPSKFFYNPKPAGGVFYRYNFHSRHALRTNLNIATFEADDLDFDNAYQQNRNMRFEGDIAELISQFEFNFLPYSTNGKTWDFTPYMAAGFGVALFDSETVSINPVIPFTLGFKVNFSKNLGLEAEYSFRKTFYDNFDGLKDYVAPDDYAFAHNNDWYFFTGISLTWKMYNRNISCPAYQDISIGKRDKIKR